jgi:hypothetical protein
MGHADRPGQHHPLSLDAQSRCVRFPITGRRADSYAYAKCDTDGNTHGHANGNAYCYTHCNAYSHTDSDAYCYRDTKSDTEATPNPASSADASVTYHDY